MSSRIIFTLFLAMALHASAQSSVLITRLPLSRLANQVLDAGLSERLVELVASSDTRKIEVDEILNKFGHTDHYILFVQSKTFHRLEVVRVNVNDAGEFTRVQRQYQMQESGDRSQLLTAPPECPDLQTEFVVFAPNDVDIEQNATLDVASAAEARGLKTVALLKTDATRANYLNYLSCPKLKGNFYDGDANPNEIKTYDGTLSANDMATLLVGAFRFQVVNIWLACEAYNDPMRGTLLNTTKAQKYAAGINDLEIGPSDQAGACAMKAAIAGSPMQESFNTCYQQLDTPSDQWGFGGNGSDYFAK